MDNVIAEIKRVKRTLGHLTTIAEQAGEGIAVVDHNGAIRFVNDALVMMHGYDNRNELLGNTISVLHSEEQMRTDVIGFVKETKQRGRLEGPIEHVRRDGTSFATQTKMTTLKNEQGNVIGLIVFVTDYSGRKQSEELLRQQGAKLAAANKQLQNQIAEYRRRENEWQQCRNHFEQRVVELRASNDQLQRQVIEQMRVENELQQYCNRLEQQIDELAAAVNKVVQFATSGDHVLYQRN
jgi:PAS domain S-box-containing protein